ncbi:MAG: type II toxin-antitoxin system VapC family toxin [Opitutaceae bacterium]
MLPRALVDSGPLAAFLNRGDALHEWARKAFEGTPGPYLTTEANVAEVCHLLERAALKGSLRLFELLDTGLVQTASLADSLAAVGAEVSRFRDRRVDFADACLLVLAERRPHLPLITADRADFQVYFRGRKNRLVLPP